MAGESVLRSKCELFSVRIVNCYKFLTKERSEFVMSKQLLRSGTSIGANVTEGLFAQSRNDFVSKLNISLKEAQETNYWLRLLHKTDYLNDKEFSSIIADNDEIIRILVATLKTVREKDANRDGE
ncbi:MAG: four helix bundle protein [Prevotella sp.]|nr:four helix bundle protein [Prevotella sp.]